MHKIFRLSWISLSAVLLTLAITACVSEPAASSQAPSWILTTPAPDAQYTYFVASASDTSGNTALATENAAIQLISQITRYMGVDIQVATTGVAKGTLDSYSADVTSVVKQTGSSKIAGFSIKDRYVVRDKQQITVYILAQYITADLQKEKARIASALKEKEDAVAKPEEQGDSAASEGRVFDAIKSYINAMTAASADNVDNASIKLERNTNKARTQLSKLRFIKIDAPTTAAINKDFPKPFIAKLVYGESDNARGVPSAEIYVSYMQKNPAGRLITKTERILTDSQGNATFTPPAPDSVGKSTITFRLNLDSSRDMLDKIPLKYGRFVDAVQAEMSDRSIIFEYTTSSIAKTVPTGLVVLDISSDNSIASTTIAQSGLFEALVREKFKTGLVSIDSKHLLSMDDAVILNLAKSQYGASLQRLIYGTAQITSTTKDASMWQASAQMVLRCVDFENGQILYSTEKTAIGIASDEASAKKEALRKVARDIVAKDLMSNLP